MTSPAAHPTYGIAEEIAPGIRRILAPNPMPMTYWGTNTYILGTSKVVVVDPGPDIDAHLAAILSEVAEAKIEAILITHSHLDHSPLAVKLSQQSGAPVLAYGNSLAGRAPHMKELARTVNIGGGEGVDHAFAPDQCIQDGDVLDFECGAVTAIWTPGHFGNHMCYSLGDALLTGDLVMGWASSLVSPPDGDLAAFMSSCNRLLNRKDTLYLPGHGPVIHHPQDRVSWLIEHRNSREYQILDTLQNGPQSAETIAAKIYVDTPVRLLPAATRNVFAHLIDLWTKHRVSCNGAPEISTKFEIQ